MAKRHSVRPQTVQSLLQQVNQSADVSGDYRFLVRVEDGEVHIGYSTKHCFECDGYEALLAKRESEKYPVIEES